MIVRVCLCINLDLWAPCTQRYEAGVVVGWLSPSLNASQASWWAGGRRIRSNRLPSEEQTHVSNISTRWSLGCASEELSISKDIHMHHLTLLSLPSFIRSAPSRWSCLVSSAETSIIGAVRSMWLNSFRIWERNMISHLCFASVKNKSSDFLMKVAFWACKLFMCTYSHKYY